MKQNEFLTRRREGAEKTDILGKILICHQGTKEIFDPEAMPEIF